MNAATGWRSCVEGADDGRATPRDLIARLQDLRNQGRHYVLLLLQDENGDRSVALPLGDH